METKHVKFLCLVQKLYNDENIPYTLPLMIIEVIMNFFVLKDGFAAILPDYPIDTKVLFKNKNTECHIGEAIGLYEFNQNPPPWLRFMGQFQFGSSISENFKMLKWKLLYQCDSDWIWLNIGLGYAVWNESVRRLKQKIVSPTASIAGHTTKNDFILYGDFEVSGRIYPLKDWNLTKPIVLEAHIREGAYKKVMVYIVCGQQRFNIGNSIMEHIDVHQYMLQIDCGLNYMNSRHQNDILKLLEFSVTYGTTP